MTDVLRWLNQNAGAVQAISTIVLVAVTVYYAWATKHIARETQTMAEGTERTYKQTQRQILDATLPVLTFRIKASVVIFQPHPSRFTLEVYNAGYGPAIDVTLRAEHPQLRFGIRPAEKADVTFNDEETTPFVLGAGEAATFLVEQQGRERLENPESGSLLATYKDIHGRSIQVEMVFALVPIDPESSERFRKFANELPLPVARPGPITFTWPSKGDDGEA